MPFKTWLTETLGVQVPIVQGGESAVLDVCENILIRLGRDDVGWSRW